MVLPVIPCQSSLESHRDLYYIGPLLFLSYIDGVTSTPLSDGSKMTLYTDNMLLYIDKWNHPRTIKSYILHLRMGVC